MNKETPGGFHPKPYSDGFNYFGKDRWIHAWLAEKRTRFFSVIFPPFVRLGVVPDTISYVGIALLAGVVLYFVRNPPVAIAFLAGHVICDGMDGAYARHTGKASQAGAFTDLVCDQLGMVVVAIMAMFHHMVTPLLGSIYVSLYLIVVVFGVIINVMGLGTRITVTSKYFLYIVYLVWAFWGINIFSAMMTLFSAVMLVEVTTGYLRLKRGIRRKFDTEERFREGDQYSGRLHYALNVAVPVIALLCIVIGANLVPLRTMIDSPRLNLSWTQGAIVVPSDETGTLMGVGVRDKDFLLLLQEEDGTKRVIRVTADGTDTHDSFVVPEYVVPVFSSLPIDGNVMLLVDGSTRLLMGIDLDASFASHRTVTVLTLPIGYLHVTAMATTRRDGHTLWFAGNYLYTRKTYLIDPHRALKKGSMLAGIVDSYTNGGFPAGMTVIGDTVIELNRSPFKSMIYVAPLARLVAGRNILDAGKISFSPPEPDALGPVKHEGDLVMLSPAGRVYRLPLNVFVKTPSGKSHK
jgi:phosphatidylglycerophosphate synthase